MHAHDIKAPRRDGARCGEIGHERGHDRGKIGDAGRCRRRVAHAIAGRISGDDHAGFGEFGHQHLPLMAIAGGLMQAQQWRRGDRFSRAGDAVVQLAVAAGVVGAGDVGHDGNGGGLRAR